MGTNIPGSSLVVLETPLVDMTAAPADYAFNGRNGAPVVAAGTYPVILGIRYMITTTAGVLSTQPTMSIGNDASFANMFALTSTTFATPFAAGAPVAQSVTAVQLNSVQVADGANPIKWRITVAAAGAGLAFSMKLIALVVFSAHP